MLDYILIGKGFLSFSLKYLNKSFLRIICFRCNIYLFHDKQSFVSFSLKYWNWRVLYFFDWRWMWIDGGSLMRAWMGMVIFGQYVYVEHSEAMATRCVIGFSYIWCNEKEVRKCGYGQILALTAWFGVICRCCVEWVLVCDVVE